MKVLPFSNPIDKIKYPNVYDGFQYAIEVVEGKIPNSKYIIGSCNRFLKEYFDYLNPESTFFFDIDYVERYLRTVQNLSHVIGKWDSDKIIYNPWQKWLWSAALGFKFRLGGYPKYRTLHIEVPRGASKPFSLDTIVPTPQGLKRWEEIGIGSELYDRHGNICRVVGRNIVFKNPESQKIIFSDGTEIVTGLEHEWFTSNKKERERKANHRKNPPKHKAAIYTYESVKTTKEIKETLKYGKDNNHSVKVCDPIVGEEKTLPVDPYFLGYWLGNGSKDSARVTVNSEDVPEIEKIFDSKGIVFSTTPHVGREASRIDSVGVLSHLRGIGVLGDKHIPNQYLTASLSQRVELLQGLLDSDGSIDDFGRVTLINGTEKMWGGVEFLISSLGLKLGSCPEFKVSENNNYKSQTLFKRFYFVPRGVETWKVFKLSRKLSKLITNQGEYTYTKNRFVVDVVDIEPREMFCVEVDSPDHSFLITERCIPTHNSTMASQSALYFIGLDPNRSGEKIACFATKSEQSRIILDAARAMAMKAPGYLKSTGVEVLAHKLVDHKTFSEMVAMSSDSKSMDGLNLRIAFLDELHQMSRELFEVVVSGMKKRRDSLVIALTTAGFNNDGIGYSQSQYAKKVALGEVPDETFFSAVYTIDEGDDIHSELTWKKANPNHGFSVDPLAVQAASDKAKVTPSDLPNFLVKTLNVWLSQADVFFDINKWDACYDETLTKSFFNDKKVYVGVDLASKVDLTCYVTVTRVDGIYYIWQKSFLPEDTLKEENNLLYDEAIAFGELIKTPGEAINFEMIEREVLSETKDKDVLGVNYDPWSAVQLAQNLMKERVNMVEFRMTTANLSEPMKTLDALIRQKKVRHNGGKLMRWCMSNVTAKEDQNGNIFPRKNSKKLKIDIAVALIMAIASWIQEKETKSIYEERGILSL